MESTEQPTDAAAELLPARMLNEVTYCPRLFYLEHVAREWAASADTVEGDRIHKRVDQGTGALPEASELGPEWRVARSVTVSDPSAGIIAKLDLIEQEGGTVSPVDYKRGRAPSPEKVPGGVWPADRVQIGAQMLALRNNGYRCDVGTLYYAASKMRVVVPWSEELGKEVARAVTEARRVERLPIAPPPLVNSPKCPGCSLVGICLPDETNALLDLERAEKEPEASHSSSLEQPDDQVEPDAALKEAVDEAPAPAERAAPGPRRLIPLRDDLVPLYVQSHGSTIGVDGHCLAIRSRDGSTERVRIRDTSHVVVFGNVQVTTQAISALARQGAHVSYFSSGGWHNATTTPYPESSVHLRIAQFRIAASRESSLPIARELIAGKILNARTLLRRNSLDLDPSVLTQLKRTAADAKRAESHEVLLGIEGSAARLYFGSFSEMLSASVRKTAKFELEGRNRRPPRDPTNALLSLAYALLVKDCRNALSTVGFDPAVGFFHQPRPGRPSLALDLMEEFRPLIADSAVLTAINTGVVVRSVRRLHPTPGFPPVSSGSSGSFAYSGGRGAAPRSRW